MDSCNFEVFNKFTCQFLFQIAEPKPRDLKAVLQNLRADFLNAVYFRRGLTCTLGLTNDLIDSGQPRAKPHLRKTKLNHALKTVFFSPRSVDHRLSSPWLSHMMQAFFFSRLLFDQLNIHSYGLICLKRRRTNVSKVLSCFLTSNIIQLLFIFPGLTRSTLTASACVRLYNISKIHAFPMF